MKKITVEIPVDYLIDIATYGRIGTNEFSKQMQIWAEKEVNSSGFQSELNQSRQEKLEKLRQNLKNVLGSDVMEKVDNAIKDGIKALNIVKKNNS